MIARGKRAGFDASRLWPCLMALQVLLCLGTGLVSALLADDPGLPPGLYDGDDDDAAVTPEPLDGAVALIVDTAGVGYPVRPVALLALAAGSAHRPRSVGIHSPLLRSPPA